MRSPTGRWPHVFLIALLFLIGSAELHADWEVRYFESGDRAQDRATMDAIEYAIWSWSERTGQSIRFAGTTTTPEQITEKLITIRWQAPEYFNDNPELGWSTFGRTQPWVYVDDRDEPFGAQIALNTRIKGVEPYHTATVVHELGHALGIHHHLDDAGAIVVSGDTRRYSLSTTDALAVSDRGSLCHAEINRERDIYIPDIEGMRANLRYRGGNTWQLDELSINPASPGCTSTYLEGNDLVITDARMPGKQMSAILVFDGVDKWKLSHLEYEHDRE